MHFIPSFLFRCMFHINAEVWLLNVLFGQRCECWMYLYVSVCVVCVCVSVSARGCECDRWVEQQCTAGLVSSLGWAAHCGGWKSIERRRNVAPVSVCVKSRWRMMMEESDSIPCTAEDGLLSSWRWNRTARDQVQIKQKIRDLPGLLKHGLNLRKKSVSYQCMMKDVFHHQYTTHIHHHWYYNMHEQPGVMRKCDWCVLSML